MVGPMTRGFLSYFNAILILLAACTSFRPGQGLTPELAQSVECDYDYLVSRADTLTTRLSGASYQYIPKVGWDAYELLAHITGHQRASSIKRRRMVADT